MNKEQQNLAWACLPNEVRDEIRYEYDKTSYYQIRDILGYFFGHINIASNSEPEEMLMVERKKVQEYHLRYKHLCNDDGIAKGICHAIKHFFGDKCLPDKETEYSKQRFRVHDKVMFNDNLCQIIGTDYDNKEFQLKRISDNHLMGWANESALEPYTEPETKPLRVGDKVKVKGEDKVREIFRILPDGRIMFGDKGNTYSPKDLELVEPETKENMEEKELNLIEILKNCQKGERFFSLIAGDVTFQGVDSHWEQAGWKPIRCTGGDYNSDGTYTDPSDKGICCLYPSRALYKEYPLDAPRAWGVWASERKPKLVLQAEIRLISNDGKTIEDYENVEVEVSDVDLTQASEAVRECLEKFHESKNE